MTRHTERTETNITPITCIHERAVTGSDAPRVRRLHPSQVRARILDAALRIWAQKGVNGASLDEVAAAAGFTKGAVYSRFKNKDDLFFALLEERILDRIETLLTMNVPRSGTVADQFAALGDTLFDAFTKDAEWQILFLDFWGRAMRDSQARQRYSVVRSKIHRQISDFITAEVTRRGGRLTLPVEQVTVSVLALANGLFIEQATLDGSVPRHLMGKLISGLIEPASGQG